MEHSTITLPEAQRIIAASQSEGVPCLPRPVSHSNDWVKPLIESGADGMLIQMVNKPEEVQSLINDIKYPPLGKRSYGVNRAQAYGFDFDTYINNWNKESIFMIQVESIEAVENIESLVCFDEVDAVMIGPLDISGSLGVPGQTSHPLVIEASKKVINACKKYGKSCGTQVADSNMKSVQDLFDLGYTFAILGSDLFVLWKWAEEMKKLIKTIK
jgi:2-dehydro-3-deoxyglucarate aldolase